MKFKSNIIVGIAMLSLLTSCGGDDDICLSGEATPRMKIKFLSHLSDKAMTLDSLYLDVDYGKGDVKNLVTAARVDSVTIPLRVDDNAFTEFYVRTTKHGAKSKIKTNYTTVSTYVSPACGFKKSYKDVGADLVNPMPVYSVKINQNEIIDENKTHLYLVF